MAWIELEQEEWMGVFLLHIEIVPFGLSAFVPVSIRRASFPSALARLYLIYPTWCSGGLLKTEE